MNNDQLEQTNVLAYINVQHKFGDPSQLAEGWKRVSEFSL